MKKEVIKWLKTKEPKLCVLATATKEGESECAVMGYAVKDDFSIILSTHIGSRKYKNIKENSVVSLVFGWSFNESTVQMEGDASVVTEGKEYQQLAKFYYSINAYTKKFKSEDNVFVVVKPTWIRRTYLSTFPAAIEEETIKD